MGQILDIATSTPTELLAYAGQLFSDTWVLIALAIGLPLGFWVINKVISLVVRHAK